MFDILHIFKLLIPFQQILIGRLSCTHLEHLLLTWSGSVQYFSTLLELQISKTFKNMIALYFPLFDQREWA